MNPSIYIYKCTNNKGLYIDQHLHISRISSSSDVYHKPIDFILIMGDHVMCDIDVNQSDVKVMRLPSLSNISDLTLLNIYEIALFEHIKHHFSLSKLIDFHAINKYYFMMFDQNILKEMGRILAQSKKMTREDMIGSYDKKLNQLMSLTPSLKNQENAFYHMFGYFKKHLTTSEKASFLNPLEQFRNRLISYDNMIDILYDLTKTYQEPYLLRQSIFTSYPLQWKEAFTKLDEDI